MSEFRLDIKTSGDDAGLKKVQSSQEALNKAIADGLALPLDRQLTAEEAAMSDFASAAAAAGESVEKFLDAKSRATATPIAAAFNPAAGLTGVPDLGALGSGGFKFSSLAEVEATENAAAALQKKIAVQGAAGNSTVQLAGLLDVLSSALKSESAQVLIATRTEQELAQSQKKLEIKERTEETKKLTEEKRNWRSVIQGLSVDIPGLGSVLRAFANPMAAAGVAVGFLISQLKNLWTEFSRPAPSAAQWKSMEAAVEKLRETVNAAAVDHAAYIRSLQEIATAKDSIATATDKVIAKLKEESRVRLELQSAAAALKTAKVDAAEKAGTITPEAAIQARAKITNDLEAAKVKEANDLQNAEIEKKNAALQQTDEKAKQLKAAREASEADLEPVTARETFNAGRVQNAKDNITAERAKRTALQKELDAKQSEFMVLTPPIRRWLDALTPAVLPGAGQLMGGQAKEEARLAKEIAASKKFEAEQQAILDTAQKTAVERAIELEQKSKAVAHAKAAETENEKEGAKLRGELPELTTKAAIEQPARKQVLELQNQTRDVQMQGALEAARKQAAEKEAREKADAARKIQDDYNRANPPRRSHGAGGGDFDDAENPSEPASAGHDISAAGQQISSVFSQSSGNVLAFLTDVVSTMKQNDQHTARSLEKLKRDLDRLTSQYKNGRIY